MQKMGKTENATKKRAKPMAIAKLKEVGAGSDIEQPLSDDSKDERLNGENY